WAARGTDTPTPSACGSLWMDGAGWWTPGAASTFQRIRRTGTHFAGRARTTQCAWMERTRRLRMNLSHGLTFRRYKRKTGWPETASLTLWAVIMDMRGWRIRFCIGGTC